jgi:hypothetical protein
MTAQQHAAIQLSYQDRIAVAPEAELPNVFTRFKLHGVLARRPEFREILPAVAHHRAALQFFANLRRASR